MGERITRIQWGPSGVTVYSSYGMVAKFTADDEIMTFTEFISDGFDTVEKMQKWKREHPDAIQEQSTGASGVQRGVGAEDEGVGKDVGSRDESEVVAGSGQAEGQEA